MKSHGRKSISSGRKEKTYLNSGRLKKPKTDFYLTQGNHKLSKKIVIFTLPSVITCPGSGECRKYCYSRKAEKCYPQVLKARMRNLRATKQENFEEQMIQALRWHVQQDRTILRLHEDGDIYSSSYWKKWKRIMRKVPEMRAFVYTKSFSLKNLWTNLPDNIILIQSYGSKYDEKIDTSKNTARVVDSKEEVKEGEYLCPYHEKWFKKCGETCAYCFGDYPKVKHVVFLRH